MAGHAFRHPPWSSGSRSMCHVVIAEPTNWWNGRSTSSIAPHGVSAAVCPGESRHLRKLAPMLLFCTWHWLSKFRPICLCRQWPRGSTRKRRARERSTEGVGRMTSNAMPTEEKAEGRRGRMDGCVGTALRYPLTQVPAIPTSLSKQAYPQAKHTKG